MSRPGHCDTCGARVDHHRPSKHIDHDFVCAWDDDVRARRYARHEGRPPVGLFGESDGVDGCVATGCLQGRHGVGWFRGHEYEPPPAAVLLERMRDRRARRIRRRVIAGGTWAYAIVYQVWIDDESFCDDWDVTRIHGDWSTMLRVTRERLGISRFVVPTPDGRDRWTLYSDEHAVTVCVWKRTVGTLVRP